ncbi:MAG TPA: FG-GAP-like repeat-containing protein [Candidatus Polarisedimenticolaceae bacterium]|nr:FG-GAP-like repeat-containing protein [Candidatus Polarisedimenticolaceae bacterium]
MKTGRAFHRIIPILAVTALWAGIAAAQDAGWQSQIAADLSAREMELSLKDGTWQAPNRAQGFRVSFTERGVHLAPRLSQSPEWEWGLAFMGTAATVRTSAQENRLDRDWGGVREWYVNEARGLKHEFSVLERPVTAALDLALTGTLEPRVSADGQAIDFHTKDGRNVLRYAELSVVDARGRTLPSHMEGFAKAGTRGIRIVFEDKDAAYPITVDPLVMTIGWSAESNQANADFGTSVATAGDVNGDGFSDVIVGADKYDNGQVDEGRAYVYLGGPSGLSTTPAWTAESNQASAFFGASVAPAGDVNGDGYDDVLVSAYGYDDGLTDQGRVYLYLGSPTGLSATPAWTAESDQASANFGRSVATAGDVNGDGYSDVIIGATTYDSGQTDEGKVFVYYGSPAGLPATPSWTAESNQAGAAFGVSVGTAGDVNGDGYDDVIIGARLYDNGQTDEGRVFLYLGSASGLAANPIWTAESDQAGANFGRSAATAGDVNGDGYADLIVGAYTYDQFQVDAGRAYIYYGNATGVPTPGPILYTGFSVNEGFGISVAAAGDVNGDGYADVIVGAYLYDGTGFTDQGRAYVYLGSASGVSTVAAWATQIPDAGAQFGWSVATAGDVNGDGYSDVIIGAPMANDGESYEGRAFVFMGAPDAPSITAGWSVSGRTNGEFGQSIATAGDVNGDGYSDVIVGDPFHLFPQARLYLGTPSGLSTTPAWEADGNAAIDDQFGYSVASAGDVNGDGYSDVVVGAPGSGTIYVYYGSPTGLGATPAFVASDPTSSLGFSVGTAGDINGDGYSDIVVGDPNYTAFGTQIGAVFVYYGSANGLSARPDIRLGLQANTAFGQSVSTAGDINGDGYSDIVVGDPQFPNSVTGVGVAGGAFAFCGPSLSPCWEAFGDPVHGARFGTSVGTAGDVNGDGYSDLIVGDPYLSNPALNAGRAYVFLGAPTFIDNPPPDWYVDGEQDFAHLSNFGSAVATAGDINGDGYSDVVIGAPQFHGGINGMEPFGKAYAYLGGPAGPQTTPIWTAVGTSTTDYFGIAVGTAGDTNGDGDSEIVVGSTGGAVQNAATGTGYLYGRVLRGLAGSPQQFQADDSAPIDQNGLSSSPVSFRVHAKGMSAAGRARVRLQWEVKPLSSPLSGTAVKGGASFVTTGNPGSSVSLDELVTGLNFGTAYRWRVRVATNSPFFPWSTWASHPWNNATETDLRTNPCLDLDGDGYGAAGSKCALPGVDCDDTRADVNPGHAEVCDGVDNNCNGVVDEPPTGTTSLALAPVAGGTRLQWLSIPGATSYDVVRGVLSSLRSSAGNFTTSLDQCTANDASGLLVDTTGAPPAGDGWYFLVRGTLGSCSAGSYDDGSPSQSGFRDGEIAASGVACP